MKKKLWIVIALVAALLLSSTLLLSGCKRTEAPAVESDAAAAPTEAPVNLENLEYAIEYIRTYYKSTPKETPGDYSRFGTVRVGLEAFTVTWSVDADEAYVKVVVQQDGSALIDVNENSDKEVPYVLTATVTDAAGNSLSTTWDHILPGFDIAKMQDIVDQAYALEDGQAMEEPVTLRGIITSIDTPYDSSYKNITVTIAITGREDKPIKCYRLKGEGADQLAMGDTITVTGIIKNYMGTIEFDAGCSLDTVVKGNNAPIEAPEDPAEIMKQAYALQPGQSLPYICTLTGTITSVDEAYSSQYNNVTVTMAVKDGGGYSVKCYRMKGTDADTLNVNDIITVTGQITNYKGTIEFGAGCSLDAITQMAPPTQPKDPHKVVDAAYKLASGKSLPYTATLTGKVTDIRYRYSEQYPTVSLTMVVEGREKKPLYCYSMTGSLSDMKNVEVGDTVTVRGMIKNFYDSKAGTNTIEYDRPTLVKLVKGEGPKTTTVTIKEALKIGAAMAHNTFTADWYSVTGEIKEVYNTQYGNMRIVDEEGNVLTLYGTYSADGKVRYDAMKVKPVAGDTVTVCGPLGQYNDTVQIKNGRITEHKPAEDVEDPVIPPVEGMTPVAHKDVQPDTAYKFYLEQKNVSKVLYFNGQMSGNFLATTEDPAEAVDVFVEKVGEGARFYFMNGEAKTYIEMEPYTDNKGNPKAKVLLSAEPTMTYTYDEETALYLGVYEDASFFYGTYNSFETFSVSSTYYITGDNAANAGKTQFVAQFCIYNGEPETPADPEADSTLTVAEVLALGASKEHNTYTENKYYVTGVITEIYNTQYGNMKISDAEGNILTIYGTFDADGTNRFDAMEVKPVVGDTVTIYGIVGQYNGTPQVKNGWIVRIGEEELPEGHLSVADAIAMGSAMEHNTYTEEKYSVTGVITEVYNTQYGNMKITDGEGNILTVYGTYSADGTVRYDALEVKPVAGDTVTVYGIVGQYNGTPQIKNGWITEHVPGEGGDEPEEPEVPEEPEADTELTLAEAVALGKSKEHNTYTAGKYYVTGVVSDLYNTVYGNMHLVDEEGNDLTIYGMYNEDGSVRYDKMDVKPVEGDTVTVYGIIGQYNGNPQMKNSWLIKLGEEQSCDHELVHMEAVAPGCHYDGNIEHWYCTKCEIVWQDEALTQITNHKNVILPATGEGNVVHMEAVEPGCHYEGNTEYWICYTCEQVWADEALTQLTNSKNVIVPELGGDVIHVEAVAPGCESDGNIEYWYCEACEQVWQDESRTQLTNIKNVVLPADHQNIVFVEAVAPSCHYDGNVKYWYCADCDIVWADETRLQITNRKNVILPAYGAEVVYVEAKEPGCHMIGNIEYWLCYGCEQVWQDKAQTQLTNIKNVLLPAMGGDVIHVEAKEPTVKEEGNIEHWYCETCEQVWQDAALTQLTNHKNVILPMLEVCLHNNLVHMEAVDAGCHMNGHMEHWYCNDCELVWQDAELTQVTNHKNVVIPALGGDVVHVEALAAGCDHDGNMEHWYCEQCEQVWQDEALTQLTNHKNVILPATGHDLVHMEAVEAGCHMIGNAEHWYCNTCDTVWSDEALTQLTNHKNVVIPALGGDVVHVEAKEPTATENGNIEHWYCEQCEKVWQDAALTQLTNHKNVILPATGPQDPAADSKLTVAEALALGASKDHNVYTEGKYYVTGVITEVYNTQYGNMKIADDEGNILTVYGTYSADGELRYDKLEVKPVAGDTVTVYGIIGQYNNTPQLKNGWITEHVPAEGGDDPEVPTEPEEDVLDTPEEIVNAAYALEAGASLEGTYTLTGEITKIDSAYSSQYKNISVIIAVKGVEDKPILVYRLKGEGAETLAVGDTITVTGSLINYNGKIEFAQGCTLDKVVKGENEAVVKPSDPKDIVDAAFALAAGESLPYEATLTGTITKIKTPYSSSYKNITVLISVSGSDGLKEIECYRMKGDAAADLEEGDTITVTGTLMNYNGTIEFGSGCILNSVE